MIKPYKVVAKAIIIDKQERVLILRKAEEERKRKETHGFDFPGGGLEPEESVIQGLAREVFEETGLRVEVVAPVYIFDEIKEEKHLVIVKFVCDQPLGDFSLSEEHDDYQWVSFYQLERSHYPDWMKDEIQRAYQIYQSFR